MWSSIQRTSGGLRLHAPSTLESSAPPDPQPAASNSQASGAFEHQCTGALVKAEIVWVVGLLLHRFVTTNFPNIFLRKGRSCQNGLRTGHGGDVGTIS